MRSDKLKLKTTTIDYHPHQSWSEYVHFVQNHIDKINRYNHKQIERFIEKKGLGTYKIQGGDVFYLPPNGVGFIHRLQSRHLLDALVNQEIPSDFRVKIFGRLLTEEETKAYKVRQFPVKDDTFYAIHSLPKNLPGFRTLSTYS